MDNEILDSLLNRVLNLEKKLEKYYSLLRVENELDFILHGTYIFEDDITNILNGNY